MSKIRKVERSSRIIFEEGQDFFKLEFSLSVIEDSFLFIGSSKDEIIKVTKEELDEIINAETHYNHKIEQIQDLINPLSSTSFLNGKPYIPGSTLKGMVRFNLEHSFKEGSGVYSCFIIRKEPARKEKVRHFLEIYGYWPNFPQEREKEKTDLVDKYCKVCDIFGNTSIAGRIVFSDAFALPKYKLKEIRIDEPRYKETKRAIPSEFVEESVAVKNQFSFTVNFNNASIEDLALLIIGTNLHKDGKLLLGMHKYSPKRGAEGEVFVFGRIQLKLTKVTGYSYDTDGFTEAEIPIDAFFDAIEPSLDQLRGYMRDFNLFENL